MMQKAFETADKYQIPVFVLSDQHFLDSLSSIPEKSVEVTPVQKHIVETDVEYARYRYTDNGLSPRGIPGWGKGIVKVDSDEHDETGHITESYEVREKMMVKRMKRLSAMAEEAVLPTELDNFAEAEIAVVSFGSNRTVLEEALRAVRSKKLGGLHFAQVYPISPKVKDLLKEKKIVVLENNFRGQFADLLVRELGVKVSKRILKSTGEPFCVEEVIEELRNYGN
jgi:2-oxoglutarate ferredoxin oxidoreductase subunit alpha